MAAIITSDVHFNLKPIDEHRWGLLPWIKTQVTKLNTELVIICGDLTDQKDAHPALLVERLVNQLLDLSEVADIILLKANHDFIDQDHPFFGFCSHLGDGRIEYISNPTKLHLRLGNPKKKVPCWFLPTISNPADAWKDIDFNESEYLFCHQTFAGAEAGNGQRLTGAPTSIFSGYQGKAFSGDIHVPQTLSHGLKYIGAPYRTNYGDTYYPRLLYIDKNGQESNLSYPCLKKHLVVIQSLDNLDEQSEIQRGDQVKVRVLMRRAEYHNWPEIKKAISTYAEKHDWWLVGIESMTTDNKPTNDQEPVTGNQISPDNLLIDYANRYKVDKASLDVGMSILKEVST